MGRELGGRAYLLCLGFSDVDLLGNRKRVVHLDPQIADSALDPRVAKQELNRSKIPCLLVDKSCLGPAGHRSKDQGRSLSFWGGFSSVHDGIGQGSNGNGGNLGGIPANGFLPAGTLANVPVNTQITGADVDRWFLALDQSIDSAAMQLYAVYQHLNADVSLINQDRKHVPAPLDDFDLVYTGAIIYF